MTIKMTVEEILKNEGMTNKAKIQEVMDLTGDLNIKYDVSDFAYSEEENSVEILEIDFKNNIVKFRFDVNSLIYTHILDDEESIEKSVIGTINYKDVSGISILEREREIKEIFIEYDIKEIIEEDVINFFYKESNFLEKITILDIR